MLGHGRSDQGGSAGALDGQPSSEAAREELERMLASAELDASERLKSFLRFIVEEAPAGRAERLKAYTIAVEVFGRDPAGFDPQSDPVVRMEAGKLRRRLDLYYRGGGGTDRVRITIPKGSYAPTFSWQRARAATDGADPGPSALPWRRWSRRGPLGPGGLALAGLVLLAAIWLRPSSFPSSWQPFTAS